MGARTMPPAERKQMLGRVSKELVTQFGKKKYYSKGMVDSALRRQGVPLDFACWNYAFFTSRAEFVEIHQRTGEACDYDAMRAQLVATVRGDGAAFDAATSSFDFDLSWLDWPDLDLSGFID